MNSKSVQMKILRRFISEVVSTMIPGSRRLDAPGNLRFDRQVKKSSGPHLWQETDETPSQKHAVCVLIISNGKILAVSRRDDPTDFGLPGGKVDPGESLEQAAARELKEETGLVARNLKQAYTADDGEYITTTFFCDAEGKINTMEEGVVMWVNKDVLLRGCFGEYNAKLFDALGL